METQNSLVTAQSSSATRPRWTGLPVVATAAVGTLLVVASAPVFAGDLATWFGFGGSTIVVDVKELMVEAGKIAMGIGMAALAFFVGASALKWLRAAA
jgi:hypothetical protein